MYKFNYEKCLARNVKNHVARETKYAKKCLTKWNEEYILKPFEFHMKWYSRLKIFKYKARSVCTFNPFTLEAHSYDHWCFVKVIKGKVVFNDYRYSHTTRNHQGMVKYLLEELGIKIDIEVNQSESLTNGIMLNPVYRSIALNEITTTRKGVRETTKKYAVSNIKDLRKEIVVLKKLGARIEPAMIGIIKKDELRNETYRLERVKAKREQWKLDNADMLKKKAYHKDFENLINSKDRQ